MTKKQGRLRFKCGPGPCYMREHVSNIEVFDRYLPGQNAMSDVDGYIESGGHVLFYEHKGIGAQITFGQRIALEKMSDGQGHPQRIWPVVIWGNPDFSGRIRWCRYVDGEATEVTDASVDAAGTCFGMWYRLAKAGDVGELERLWRRGDLTPLF